jgi:formamidopyrimidine-DNA glycosylase
MMEIPESFNISKQLNKTIKNKVIKNIIAAQSPHKFAFYFKDNPDNYNALLTGKKIGDIRPFAGQIEISAEETKIVLAEGVNIRYLDKGEKIPDKHHLLIEFEDNSSIVCTVQMYGVLYAFTDGENDNPYYHVSKEKPSPLTEDFNSDYFENMISETKSTLSVKALLATEQRIPGLGNGVLQDILFISGINPKSKIKFLNTSEKTKLFLNIKNILKKMSENGGRDTEKDLFGNYGSYKTLLSAKTYKNPCPVCGNPITKQAYLGGNIYFCPVCQPLKI